MFITKFKHSGGVNRYELHLSTSTGILAVKKPTLPEELERAIEEFCQTLYVQSGYKPGSGQFPIFTVKDEGEKLTINFKFRRMKNTFNQEVLTKGIHAANIEDDSIRKAEDSYQNAYDPEEKDRLKLEADITRRTKQLWLQYEHMNEMADQVWEQITFKPEQLNIFDSDQLEEKADELLAEA